MIPKEIVEKLVGNGVYIYIKGITKEFGGIVESITSEGVLILKDKNNNLSYIPLDEIDIITERR